MGRRRRQRGAALVEAAIALPICLVLILGLFEFGRVVMIRQLIDNAAREAARQAIVGTTTLTVSGSDIAQGRSSFRADARRSSPTSLR